MNRSFSFFSALALGSSAVIGISVPEAEAMTIAFDCFDRNTQQLVARSAVDMTNITISCLPVPGGNIASNPGTDSNDQDIIEINDEQLIDEDGISSEDESLVEENYQDDDYEDDNYDDEDGYTEDDLTTESEPSTGDQLGEALGNHLGRLIGQGIADIFD